MFYPVGVLSGCFIRLVFYPGESLNFIRPYFIRTLYPVVHTLYLAKITGFLKLLTLLRRIFERLFSINKQCFCNPNWTCSWQFSTFWLWYLESSENFADSCLWELISETPLSASKKHQKIQKHFENQKIWEIRKTHLPGVKITLVKFGVFLNIQVHFWST